MTRGFLPASHRGVLKLSSFIPRTAGGSPLDTDVPLRSAGERLGRNLLVMWHLLSLDAPTVATVWTIYIGSAEHMPFPVCVPVSMFAAVWVLYAADRLLDSRILNTTSWSPRLARHPHAVLNGLGLEARHFFHHRHRRSLMVGIAASAVLLAGIVPELKPAAIRLDLILGSLLFAYFVLIHVSGSAHRLPKEISVGLFFSAAVFVPTVAGAPQLRLALLPLAVLFAGLCCLNCLLIYRWEHAPEQTAKSLPEPHWLTRTALNHLSGIGLSLAAAGLALSATTHRTTPLPVVLAVLLLMGLHRLRDRLAPLTLRAAADLVLLTPLPLLLLRHLR